MYEFRDFDHFIATYLMVVENLRDTEDFRLLTEAVLDRLAAQGVRYRGDHVDADHPHLTRPRADGRVRGPRDRPGGCGGRGGPVVRWVTDLPGHLGPEAAEETLDLVLGLGGGVLPDPVVGFGLGGPEVDWRPFAGALPARARRGCGRCPTPGRSRARSPSARRWTTSAPIGSGTASPSPRTRR